ncbi:MAG: hypothetical protein VXW32_16410 [Myxococcota bacterium]|nr:hypothetical protein [Myxococcota bacterium]
MRWQFFGVALGVSLLACGDNGGTDPGSLLELRFELDEESVRAGEDVGYIATMDDAGMTVPTTISIESDQEAELDINELTVSPTVAGVHTLVASAEYSGQTYTASVQLSVSPADPERLDLQIGDVVTDVGVPVSYDVVLQDAYGNGIDSSAVQVETSSSDLSLVEGEVVTTLPGVYDITASLLSDDPEMMEPLLQDTESLVVRAGAPASLDLWLEHTELELGDTTIAHVDVFDQYGNAIDADWVLWSDPVDGVAINYNVLSFTEEGWYDIYASLADGSMQDIEGPVLIDSSGPDLEMDEQPRGNTTRDSGQTYSGSATDEYSGLESVVVNGTEAGVAEDGTWEAYVAYQFGLNVVETVATDGDGNPTTDIRSTLQGDFTPNGDPIDNGLMVRINEDGFDAVEDLASDFLDISTLAAQLPSPVYSNNSQSCINWWWGGSTCWDWYTINFYVGNLNVGSTTLDLNPTAAGDLDTTAYINSPYLDWSASGNVVGIGYSASGTINADWIRLSMDLTPSITNSNLNVAVSNSLVDTQNFSFYLDSWIYDVMSFFGVNIDAIIEGLLVDALADMAQDEVPGLVNEALEGLEIGETFSMGGIDFDLDAIPYSVAVDDKGLTLGLATWFTAQQWVTPYSAGLGSLTYPYTPPSFTTPNGEMELGIGEDFLNQAFYAMWSGGLLEMQLTDEDLGLDMDDLSLFMPGLSAMTVKTSGMLPPVVVPGTGSGLLDLQIGDMELAIYDGEAIEDNLFLRVYVHLIADMDLETSTANALVVGIGDMDIWFDLDYPNARSRYAGDTEAFLGELMPLLVPMLSDSLGEFPIPSLEGLSVGNISVGLDGPENGYVVASGEIVVEQ